MVEISDKLLKECKQYLISNSAIWRDGGGVCKGKCVHLTGDLAEPGHPYCHSWVTYAYTKACGIGYKWDGAYKKDAKNFLTLSCHSKVRSKSVCSPEASDALVLWMAKESPFSRFVLNRDDDNSLTEGGVILLCGPDGLSLAEAMWVCKVLRFTTEGAAAADTFLSLVKGGVDPMLAVFVASHVRSIKGATFGYTGVEGHSTVFSDYDRVGSILGLFARNVKPRAGSTATVFAAPEKVKADLSFSAAAKKVQSFCKPVKKSDGWGGTVEGAGADGKVLVERVLEWQKELTSMLPEGFKIPDPHAVQVMPRQIEAPMPDSNTVYLELDL